MNITSSYTTDCSRPSYVACNSKIVPSFIAGLYALLVKSLRFICGYFIIGNQDTPAMSIINCIEQIQGMQSRSRTSEEINN